MRQTLDDDEDDFDEDPENPDPADMDEDEEADTDEIDCPYCGKSISALAQVCPFCRNYLSTEDQDAAPPARKPLWIWLIVIALIAALSGVCWLARS